MSPLVGLELLAANAAVLASRLAPTAPAPRAAPFVSNERRFVKPIGPRDVWSIHTSSYYSARPSATRRLEPAHLACCYPPSTSCPGEHNGATNNYGGELQSVRA